MARVTFEVTDNLKRELNVLLAKRGLTAKEFFTNLIKYEITKDKGVDIK